jgi:hypothetical protein
MYGFPTTYFWQLFTWQRSQIALQWRWSSRRGSASEGRWTGPEHNQKITELTKKGRLKITEKKKERLQRWGKRKEDLYGWVKRKNVQGWKKKESKNHRADKKERKISRAENKKKDSLSFRIFINKCCTYNLTFSSVCVENLNSAKIKCLRGFWVLFATVLWGPRINSCFVSPLLGLFFTCRGEKYI